MIKEPKDCKAIEWEHTTVSDEMLDQWCSAMTPYIVAAIKDVFAKKFPCVPYELKVDGNRISMGHYHLVPCKVPIEGKASGRREFPGHELRADKINLQGEVIGEVALRTCATADEALDEIIIRKVYSLLGEWENTDGKALYQAMNPYPYMEKDSTYVLSWG